MSTFLASKTLKMVDIILGPHDHLKGWDDLLAGGAVAGGAKESEVVPLAEQEVALGVERLTHLTQTTVTTATLQTRLMPVHVNSLRQKDETRSLTFFSFFLIHHTFKMYLSCIFLLHPAQT